MVSSVQRRELFLDHLDQLSHAVAVKNESRAGGLVEVRQRSSRPERKRLAVMAHSRGWVVEAVAPDLERTVLGDAVFDVVEGECGDTRLVVPAGEALGVQAGPVHR